MTEPNRDAAETPPLLFLSVAGNDGDAALRLAERIEATPTAQARGLKVFVDRREDEGQGFDKTRPLDAQRIEAVGRSTAFAVYLGAEDVVNWVEEEVRLGIGRAREDGDYSFTTLLAEQRSPSRLPGFSRLFHTIRLADDPEASLDPVVRGLLRLDAEEIPAIVSEPFLGLDPFEAVHRPLFFGREVETADLLDRLRRKRLVMLTGAPGTGKSSLAKAGAVALWQGGVLAPEGIRSNAFLWHVIEARPGRNAFRNLGDAVFRAAEGLVRTSDACRTWRDWVFEGSTEQRRAGLRCGLPEDRTRTLLLIDQFEELFTQCPESQRSTFMALLLDLAEESDPAFSVLLTMREDHDGLLAGTPLHERLAQENGTARIRLDRMPPEKLAGAIEEPLRLAGVLDEADRKALSAAVLSDVGLRTEDLARIGFALGETWDQVRRHGGSLVTAYAGLGRVDALARTADALLPATDAPDSMTQALAEALFAPGELPGLLTDHRKTEAVLVRLVQFGDLGGVVRRTAQRSEFDGEQWSLVETLAGPRGHRLVRIIGAGDAATTELASAAILAHWPRFQGRLRDAAPDLRLLEKVRTRTRSWSAASPLERPDRLASSGEAASLAPLLEHRATWLSADEREWLSTSLAKAGDEKRRSRRLLFGSMAAALVFALAGGLLYALFDATDHARAEARRERDQLLTIRSRFFADLSHQAIVRGNPTEGVLWALEGLPDENTPDRPWVAEAELGLYSAYVERRPVAVLRHEDRVWSVVFSPDGKVLATAFQDATVRLWDAATGAERGSLKGHTGVVRTLAFSPDGRLVATASADGTARLWDARTGAQLAILSGHTGEVGSVAFSPDGTRLATGGDDGTARLWDTASGAAISSLSGHVGLVRSVVFSRDGGRLATASGDATPRLWDARTGQQIATLTGHTQVVWSIAFSADNAHIATGSFDRTARLWDAKTGDQLAVLAGHDGPVMSVAYSPTGGQLATTSGDNTARVWDTRTGAALAVLKGHAALVMNADFSPDGTRLATASQDTTVRIWDTATGENIATLTGHTGWVTAVTYSPDGARLATASQDRTARLWEARSADELQMLTGHTAAVQAIAFSPEGAWIGSASDDSTARLWDVISGASIRTLKGHTDGVTGVAFSAEGARLATASKDKTVRIWDVGTGDALGTLGGHEGAVSGVAFSPDGARLATAAADGVVRFWNAATGAFLANLRPHTSAITGIAFSPDGLRLATAAADGVARIWDIASGTEIRSLRGHAQSLTSIAFSPDGLRLATGSTDATARIWNTLTGKEIAVLKGHAREVRSVAFTRDGTRVATGSADTTARLWNATTGAGIAVLRGHRSDVLGVAFSADGTGLATASRDNAIRLWRVLPMREALIAKARQAVTACLTREQRDQTFLDPAPPDWCIDRKKPPYDTQAWRDWLIQKRAGKKPPLPS